MYVNWNLQYLFDNLHDFYGFFNFKFKFPIFPVCMSLILNFFFQIYMYVFDRGDSILGPLLFNTVYINDLPSCKLFSKPRMYADDTTLTSSAEEAYALEHKMNCDINLIQSWLTANKFTLNVKKTKCMLIGNKSKLPQLHEDFTVKVHNTPLDRVNKHKYLGVFIDQTLNWRPRINATSRKISAGLAILKRVSTTLPFDTRLNMYKALVIPYFNNCVTVWRNISKGLSD